MTVTTISSREFNQDVSRARRAADQGPVIITERYEPAYVLLRQMHVGGWRVTNPRFANYWTVRALKR